MSKSKIIVIANDTNNRLALTITLMKTGYAVNSFNGDYEAVEMVLSGDRKDRFDMLVVDFDTSNENDHKIVETILDNDFGIPVMILGSTHNKSLQGKILKDCRLTYMEKPFRSEEFLVKVKSLLCSNSLN